MIKEIENLQFYTHGRTVQQELRLIKKAINRILKHPNEEERVNGLIELERITEAAVKEYSGKETSEEIEETNEGG